MCAHTQPTVQLPLPGCHAGLLDKVSVGCLHLYTENILEKQWAVTGRERECDRKAEVNGYDSASQTVTAQVANTVQVAGQGEQGTAGRLHLACGEI